MRIFVQLPLFFLLALFCLLRGSLGQSGDENSRVTSALGGAKAPIFNAYFPTQPSTGATLNYQWMQSDSSDSSSTAAYHQGLASLSGAANSYIDVNTATGPNSCGLVLPQIGGAGSGTGVTQGWTVEVVVKLTGAVGGWAKLIDFGDGTAIGSTTNDLMLTWDGNDNNETGLLPGLAAQQLSSPPPATQYNYASCPMIKPQLNQWYHITLVMQAVNVAAASATWFIYVNGQLLPYSTQLQSGATFTAFQGANLPLPLPRNQSYIGRSDYGDPNLSAVFDAVRVYDYALSATQVTGLASAYNLNTGVTLPQNSNSQSLSTTAETNFWQRANISRAPVLNAVFPSDPSSAIGTTRLYNWMQSDSADNSTVQGYHQGVVQLTGAQTSFIDLNTPTGANSAGLVMGFFGGAGSGSSSNSSQGWSVEMVVKPTSHANYSKLLTIGNGGYLDVFFIGWDGMGQTLYVEQTNNVNVNLAGVIGQTDLTIPVSIALNQWVHIAVVMRPTNMALYVGTWTVYVNGVQVAYVADPTMITYPVPTYRDQSYIGASDYQDPNAAATYDAVRVYDQALTASQVQLMAQQYGLSSGGTLGPAPSTGGAAAMAAFSAPLMALLALLAFFSI